MAIKRTGVELVAEGEAQFIRRHVTGAASATLPDRFVELEFAVL